MASANACRIQVGRLMEIDVASGYEVVSDIDDMIAMIKAELGKLPADVSVIIAADWRPCRVFSAEVADRAHAMLTGATHRTERSAILHRTDQATSVMQVMRLVREAQFPARRVFTSTTAMEDWLSEVLTPAERARLRTFLGQR